MLGTRSDSSENTADSHNGLSETASITVMEIVAIGTDVWLAGEAGMGEILFWTALVFSLTMGLLAAYPVNLLLIHFGVKKGMMNPAKMSA